VHLFFVELSMFGRTLIMPRYILLSLIILWSFPAFAQRYSNHYALILADPPVLERFPAREAARSAAGESYRREIEAKQQSLKAALEARNFHVVGSVSMSSNSVFVIAAPERVAELQSLPGVTAVIRMRMHKANLNRATQLMNAPTAWNLLGGVSNAGSGIKIAILDSGIDQTHPAFQDPSLQMPAGFPICTASHPEDCAYTNNKVIVARSYVRLIAAPSDPANPAVDSSPDDYSPRDRDGHGTAVASVAAANQNSFAVTFTGMAPKAWLGSYKIQGTVNGSPEDIGVMALNDAFNDGMDIANYSLGALATTAPLDTGAACGLPAGTPCDFSAFNFEKIAQAGMVIAVSVGNDGFSGSQQFPTFNLVSSPSNAPSVIAAGATMNSHVFEPGVSVPGGPSNLQFIAAQSSDGFSGFTSAVTLPLIDVTTVGNDGYACTSLPANSLNGAIALIQRGPATNACTFVAKATNAANAGALGVIFYMYDSTAPLPVELQDSVGDPPPLFAVMIALSDGQNLKSYAAQNPGLTVTVDPAGTEMDIAAFSTLFGYDPPLAGNEFLGFSSPGPDAGDLSIKPDLVATGGTDPNYGPDPNDTYFFGPSGMYVAAQSYDPSGAVYSPTGYAAADGTSFAAPMVAGAAALLKQLNPNLKAPQIKAILMTSAAHNTTVDEFGDPVDVIQTGAGRLDAGAAANATFAANVVTTDGTNPVSLSFGALKSGSLPITKQIQLTNFGSSPVTLAVSTAANIPATGISIAVDKTSVTVGTGSNNTAAVNVTLSGSIPSTAGEYSGSITFQGGGVSAAVPYMFLVSDGAAFDLIPILFGQAATNNSCTEGLPGQDIGPLAVKLFDSAGVPLVGTSVTFSLSPRGSATLGSSTVNSVGYKAPACTPASSSTSVVCKTDQYGIAYAELTLSKNVGATPGITAGATGVSFIFGGASVCPPAVIPPPDITSVTDPASGGTTIVPGSYMLITGANVVNANNITAADGVGDYANFPPLPFSLDGVTVSFDVPGSYDGKPQDYNGQPGHVTFVSADASQVIVQVPWELQGATSAQVKVTMDGFAPSNVVTVPLAPYAPAVFPNPNNTAIAYAYDVTSQSEVSSTSPAHAGDTVQLFANGLGPVNNQPVSGGDIPAAPNQATTMSTPAVTIGGQPATVSFSGLTYALADSPLWFQYTVTVTIPAGLPAGNQPVVLSIGGANATALPIPIK